MDWHFRLPVNLVVWDQSCGEGLSQQDRTQVLVGVTVWSQICLMRELLQLQCAQESRTLLKCRGQRAGRPRTLYFDKPRVGSPLPAPDHTHRFARTYKTPAERSHCLINL